MKNKTFKFLSLVMIISMVIPTAAIAKVPAADETPLMTVPEARAEPLVTVTDPYVSEPFAPHNTAGTQRGSGSSPIVDLNGEMPGGIKLPVPDLGDVFDPIVQRVPYEVNIPAPLTNWEGISNTTGVYPPDTDGQVGPNHYLQIVNSGTEGSQIRVWDKSGNELYDFGMNSMWPTGDDCNTYGNGDPVVLYDQLVDRWVLTQFAVQGPFYECIAVSKSPTPTDDPNDWHLYSFLVHATKMNDYPKLGVWPDGYYMSVNQFDPGWAGAGVFVFDRAAMLNGDPATFQYFDLAPVNFNWGSLLPSNLMGDTLPPTGSPNYFVNSDVGANVLNVFEFHTDWTTPANSTFSLVQQTPVEPFDINFECGRSCVPQPDTDQGLDIMGRMLMHLWYRNFGDHEVLVSNQTVDVGDNQAGVRWYEIRDPGANAYVFQQGTYAPDEHHRWMGSIAMDRVGNLGLGYSISSETMYPSIRYTGRLASDPLGVMAQGEEIIITGSGSQTGTANRWGDYSAMSVDPVDDCTFWFTQEYYETTSAVGWQTRVASFRFPKL